MTRATARLKLEWSVEREKPAPSRLDERFLLGPKCPKPVSFPFLPELQNEILKSWGKPFSACVFSAPAPNCCNVKGLEEHGCVRMPLVKEALASYLSPEVASLWKAPVLPMKLWHLTSKLVGRVYSAGGALHALCMLQAYQADLLGDLDQGEGLSAEAVLDLRHIKGLCLCVNSKHLISRHVQDSSSVSPSQVEARSGDLVQSQRKILER